jgi:dTDP-4-amino-4,6-dideoxygalactose transaminase
LIPLLKPLLPNADALRPFLERIDVNRFYTNFGTLHDEFLEQLIGMQRSHDGATIHGVLTSSCTTGLELAISALGLPAGSRVAVPAFTFPATAMAVQRCGHVPTVFDVDPETWLLSPEQLPIERMPSAGIRAVIPVAAFGVPQDVLAWSQWSRTHNIPVVVDAAASIGAQKICADITVVFSLHATKALSSGEGGVVFTQNSALAARLRAMSNFGINLDVPSWGTNAKMSEYHAAVGLAHLALWPSQVAARMELLRRFKSALSFGAGTTFCYQLDTGIVAPTIFCLQFSSPDLRTRVEGVCRVHGIQTRRWYLPLLQHQSMLFRCERPLPTPNAEWLAQTLLGLPFFIGITEQEFSRVVEMVLVHGKDVRT